MEPSFSVGPLIDKKFQNKADPGGALAPRWQISLPSGTVSGITMCFEFKEETATPDFKG